MGKELVKVLAETPQFTRVTLIGRRQVNLPGPDTDARYNKFDEKIIDFDNLSEYADAFKVRALTIMIILIQQFTWSYFPLEQGYDVGFSSLGTTRAKAGAEGFYKVDHDYVVNAAKLAKEGGCKHFHLVSSKSANKDAYFLYPKTKGEVEEEVKAMGFDRVSIYRPGLFLVERQREDFRIVEGLLRAILKPLDFRRSITTDVALMAKVMVANTFREGGSEPAEILETRDINAMAKSLPKADD